MSMALDKAALKHGWTDEEKEAVRAAAAKKKGDPEELSVADFEEVARDVGVIVTFFRAVTRWFGQLFG